jgi:LysR family nitrogen assimilation transcriptional regulator
MIDTRKLAQFLVIAESRSLSRAAERLHIAQPALTRAVKLLEQELGVVLLERHARGISLTELGRLLADQARLILREVERTRELIRERADNPAGNVRLAFPSIIAGDLTVTFLKRLSTRHRKIEITFVERDSTLVEDAVKTGHCDAALTFSPTAGNEVILRPMLVDELAALLPLNHSAEEVGISITDLLNFRLALLPKEDPIRSALDEAALRQAVKLDTMVEVVNCADLRALLQAGYSTVLPSSAAARMARESSGRLRWLKDPRVPCGLFLITARHRPLSQAAAVAIEELIGSIEALVNSQIWIGRYVGTLSSSAAAFSIVANQN